MFAHYISRPLVATVISIITLTATLTLIGCGEDGIFGPKDQFYGGEKNLTQWRLMSYNPADTREIHQMDPGGYFSAYLTGSELYTFSAWLPDGTIIAQFQARINQVSYDGELNGSKVDWAWIIGGPFYASPSPNPQAADASVSITGYTSAAGLPAPDVVYVNDRQMAELHTAMQDTSPKAAAKLAGVMATIAAQEVK